MPADHGGPVGRLQDRRQHAQRRGFSRAVRAQQSVNLSGTATKAHAIDRADFSALLVVESFGQVAYFDHRAFCGRSCRSRRACGQMAAQRESKMLPEGAPTVRWENAHVAQSAKSMVRYATRGAHPRAA